MLWQLGRSEGKDGWMAEWRKSKIGSNEQREGILALHKLSNGTFFVIHTYMCMYRMYLAHLCRKLTDQSSVPRRSTSGA